MRSTMQDVPLSIATIVRYGTTVHGASEVVTWTGDGVRRATFAEVGRRAAQLAHALRGLGVTGDERVGTFMWNNQEHLEAYLAVPAMGAVLHTAQRPAVPRPAGLHHRPRRRTRSSSSTARCCRCWRRSWARCRRSSTWSSTGPPTRRCSTASTSRSTPRRTCIAGQPETFDWVEVDERDAAAMCYTSGTTGNPKGVVYSHRSIYLHSMQVCMGGRRSR